ncbi:MAG: hypothetical protein ACK5VX_09595, partial [Akkermansiaceae bacterium]
MKIFIPKKFRDEHGLLSEIFTHPYGVMNFSGIHTALITPFRNGKVDTEAYRSLLERQIAGGLTALAHRRWRVDSSPRRRVV